MKSSSHRVDGGHIYINWSGIPSLVTIVTVLALPMFAGAANDPGSAQQPATREEAAKAELQELHQIAVVASDPKLRTEDKEDLEAYAKELGFASTAETAQAELAPPLRIYTVPLDRMKAFREGDDPEKLLVDTQSLMYPLMVRGEARSSIIVGEVESEKGKAWDARTGAAKIIRMIEQHRRSSSNFIVEIPVPGRPTLRFLDDRVAGQLVLIPITNTPTLGLKAGQQVPARDLFGKVAPEVKALDQPVPKRKADKDGSFKKP